MLLFGPSEELNESHTQSFDHYNVQVVVAFLHFNAQTASEIKYIFGNSHPREIS